MSHLFSPILPPTTQSYAICFYVSIILVCTKPKAILQFSYEWASFLSHIFKRGCAVYLSLKFLGTVQAARFVCLLLPPKDLYQISVKARGALLTPSLAQVYFCKVLLWVFFGLLPSCLLTADLLQWSATEGKYWTHSVQCTLWFLSKTDFQFYQTTKFPMWKKIPKRNVKWLS